MPRLALVLCGRVTTSVSSVLSRQSWLTLIPQGCCPLPWGAKIFRQWGGAAASLPSAVPRGEQREGSVSLLEDLERGPAAAHHGSCGQSQHTGHQAAAAVLRKPLPSHLLLTRKPGLGQDAGRGSSHLPWVHSVSVLMQPLLHTPAISLSTGGLAWRRPGGGVEPQG